MKKIVLAAAVLAIAFVACKKDEDATPITTTTGGTTSGTSTTGTDTSGATTSGATTAGTTTTGSTTTGTATTDTTTGSTTGTVPFTSDNTLLIDSSESFFLIPRIQKSLSDTSVIEIVASFYNDGTGVDGAVFINIKDALPDSARFITLLNTTKNPSYSKAGFKIYKNGNYWYARTDTLLLTNRVHVKPEGNGLYKISLTNIILFDTESGAFTKTKKFSSIFYVKLHRTALEFGGEMYKSTEQTCTKGDYNLSIYTPSKTIDDKIARVQIYLPKDAITGKFKIDNTANPFAESMLTGKAYISIAVPLSGGTTKHYTASSGDIDLTTGTRELQIKLNGITLANQSDASDIKTLSGSLGCLINQ